jgi:hypothetical protein
LFAVDAGNLILRRLKILTRIPRYFTFTYAAFKIYYADSFFLPTRFSFKTRLSVSLCKIAAPSNAVLKIQTPEVTYRRNLRPSKFSLSALFFPLTFSLRRRLFKILANYAKKAAPPLTLRATRL